MVAEEFEVISQNGVVVDVEAEVDKLHALFRERTKLIHSLKDPKELEEQQVNVARQNLFSELAKLPFQERALARLKINFKSDECNKLVEEADDDDDDDEGIEEETVEKDGLEQLFNIDEHGKTYFNEKVLDDLCRQIGNRKVAVISTAGKYRQGKTFWSNVLLRGLRHGDARFEENEEIGGKNGIHYKMSYDAHTKGIMVWPEIYTRKINGEEVAVILLDTQGTFDMETDTRISAVIFAISLLMSSTQILNIKGWIGANDLDALNVFLEFSRGESDKCGQDFVLLLRDIPDKEKDGKIYGLNASYLTDLRTKTGQVDSLRQLVKGMEDAFEKVECCLVPNPADAVLKSSAGIRAAACGKPFLDTLSNLANHLLQNLRPKMFRESALTGHTLKEYVQNLCTIIKSKECRREIASAFDATVNLYLEKALATGLNSFNGSCDQFARDNHYQAVPPGVFGEALKSFKTKAEEAYNGVSRFGGPSLKQQQFKKFSDSIQEKVDDKVQHNGERYKDSKVANAVNDSYSKYEKMMKPDLLSQLQGADRIKHVQGQHDEARKAAMQHFESEISEFGGEPVIVEKRDILKKMIEDRYEDLQTNNAIQGVQEMAREIVEKTAQEFQTILAQSLSGLVDETSMELSVTKARMRIESTYGLHTQTLLDNPGLAKLDKKTVEAFLNNFKQARLETQLTKEEAQFKSQAQLFLAGKVTEKKIAELQKHATEAEEAFSREREDHERRMKNNEDLIDAEKKRSEKLLEEAKEDIAFKKEMQRLRLEFEMKKDENERLGELKKQEMINAIEEKRIRMQETAAAARARQTDEELRQTQKATDMRFQQNKEQMLYEKEIRINQLKREEAAEAAKREADEKREERMHEQELRQLEAASKERREKLQQEHEAKIREIERLAAKDAKEAAEIEATKAANAQRHAAEMKRLDEETTARIEDQRIAQAEQKEKIRAERERADQQAKREMEAIRVKNELARKKLEMEEKREADRLAADKVNKAREAAEREAASKHKREMEDKEQKKRHEKWWQKII